MTDSPGKWTWHKPIMRMLEFDVSAGTQKYLGSVEVNVDSAADYGPHGPPAGDFQEMPPASPPTGPS